MNQIESVIEAYGKIPFNNYITSFLILVGFWMLKQIYEKFVFKIAKHGFKRLKSGFVLRTWATFKTVISSIIMISGFYYAINNLVKIALVLNITKSLIVINIAIGIYRMIERESLVYTKLKKASNIEVSKILEPFFIKIARFIIIVITASIVAEIFGYRMDTIIAGLGIGGVAVALAAQDSLSNLIGGIIILMDKPFDIDDYINCEGIEGIVEDISFRSTRIRTFDKELVFVPNSIMSKNPITNYSKRDIRRAKFKIGLTYNSKGSQIEKVVSDIDSMLKENSEIDADSIVVSFESFEDSNLSLLIVFHVKTHDYKEFLNTKQSVNINILNIIENNGLSIAYPSTSVYFGNKLNNNETTCIPK